MVAVHDFLLALTEPSLQMKVSPWQRSIPPLRPLQGVLAASDAVDATSTAMTNAVRNHPCRTRRLLSGVLMNVAFLLEETFCSSNCFIQAGTTTGS